jgi:hypothetical protein
MYHDFLGPRVLQGTHMDTLKPNNSKSILFTVTGGFFTFWAILAYSAPVSKIKSEGCPALRRWRLSSLAVAGSSLLSADVDAGAELRETWKHSKIFFQHI